MCGVEKTAIFLTVPQMLKRKGCFSKEKIAFLQNTLLVGLRYLVLKTIGQYMVVELASLLRQAKVLRTELHKYVFVCVTEQL